MESKPDTLSLSNRSQIFPQTHFESSLSISLPFSPKPNSENQSQMPSSSPLFSKIDTSLKPSLLASLGNQI